MVPDYCVGESKRTLFDYLLYKQHCLGKDVNSFNISINRIYEETGIKKTKTKKILYEFESAGWLKVSKGSFLNNPHTNLFVDYAVLTNHLDKYIKTGTPTYDYFIKIMQKYADIQTINEEEINEIRDRLQTVFDARFSLYNEHHTKKYQHKMIPLTPGGKEKIMQYLRDKWCYQLNSDDKLYKGFVAFSDAILYKKIETKDPIITYLWKDDSGHYVNVQNNYNTAVTYDYFNPEEYPDECGINPP